MRKLAAAGALAIIIYALTLTPSDGWLHTEDGLIKDSSGNIVILRGLDMFTCLQNEQLKFTKAKEMGANVIRLAIWKNAVEGSPTGPCVGAQGLQSIDLAIGYAKNAGLKIILDQHIWGLNIGTAPSSFFTDPAVQETWLAMWRILIDRYQDNDTVIGIDLMNEAWSIRPIPDNARMLWEEIAKNAVNQLKPRNPKLIFFVEGWGPVTEPLWTDMAFLQQPNIVLSDHVYGEKTTTWLATRYSAYISHGIPVWLGEIGFLPSEQSFMLSQLEKYDALGLHYALFVYGVNSWALPNDIVDRSYNLTAIGKIYSDHILALQVPSPTVTVSSSTPTATVTASPTITATFTPTSSQTSSQTPTTTAIPTSTRTDTPSPSPTSTPTPTATPSPECHRIVFSDGEVISVCRENGS